MVLEAWDEDGDGRLNITEFTRCASDVRTFRDADVDKDGQLSATEFDAALTATGVAADMRVEAFAKHADVSFGSYVSLVSFGGVMRELIDHLGTKSFHVGAVTVSAVTKSSPGAKIITAGGHVEGSDAARVVMKV